MPALRRSLAVLAVLAASACTPTNPSTVPQTTAPTTLQVSPAALRTPELGLPFHTAAIVDLAVLPPQPGEQWRLASGDAEGWVRIWADGKLLAAWHAHRGGLTALEMAPDGVWYTAGVDGRVYEWTASKLEPVRSFTFGRPITALAVAGPHLAISDGRYVTQWTRTELPQLVWSMASEGFVTGLAMSASGGVVAAAELRQAALKQGIATHPLAPFEDAQGVDPDRQAELRALAQRDFPGAVADYVEVWQPSQSRSRQLSPRAPIDADLGVLSRGGIVYREIYSSDNAGLIGRRLEDTAHFPLELTKPWVFWTDEQGNSIEAGTATPNLPVADFRLGPSEEVLVLDLFSGWGAEPPGRGWRVGDGREFAIGLHHAALGDAQGNLAVVAWARPTEPGWLAPGEVRPDLLAAASGKPQIVTATIEPRTHYRLWALDEGRQRSIRVEAPWHVLPDDGSRETDPAVGVGMYPFLLGVDAGAQYVIASLSSYGEEQQAAIRALRVGDGGATILTLATSAAGLDVAISPDGAHVLAWAPGDLARSWKAPTASSDWSPGPNALAGIPRFSADGRWSTHVSGLERTIVDLKARKPVVTAKHEQVGEDLGAGSLVAIATDGTLAVVQPFGGGTLERIDVSGQTATVELPGAATALTWVPVREGDPVLVIGFQDGSIARLDPIEPQADESESASASESAGEQWQARPIHAGAGGRIWDVAALGDRPGVFVELDERGLTLHRLDDDATLELYLGDSSSMSRTDTSPLQPLSGEDLVVVWRPGTAMPPCRILDGSRAGVVAAETIERWPVERAGELFAEFYAGTVACIEPEPPIEEPTPTPTPASTETDAKIDDAGPSE